MILGSLSATIPRLNEISKSESHISTLKEQGNPTSSVLNHIGKTYFQRLSSNGYTADDIAELLNSVPTPLQVIGVFGGLSHTFIVKRDKLKSHWNSKGNWGRLCELLVDESKQRDTGRDWVSHTY